MKKRNLKSLHLNKRSISNLQQHQIRGASLLPFTSCTIGTLISYMVCPDPVEPAEPMPVDPVGPVDTNTLETTSEVLFSIPICSI